MEEFVPFESALSDGKIRTGSLVCLGNGFLVFVMYLIYQTTKTKQERSLIVQLGLALVSSIMLGIGFVLLLLQAGLYL